MAHFRMSRSPCTKACLGAPAEAASIVPPDGHPVKHCTIAGHSSRHPPMEAKSAVADVVGKGDVKADRCPSGAAGQDARHHAHDHDFVMVHGESDCSRDQASTLHPSNHSILHESSCQLCCFDFCLGCMNTFMISFRGVGPAMIPHGCRNLSFRETPCKADVAALVQPALGIVLEFDVIIPRHAGPAMAS